MTHNATSGVAHFAVPDDRECLRLVRELLGYLPSNNVDEAPHRETADSERSGRSCARSAGARIAEPALRHARSHPRRRG